MTTVIAIICFTLFYGFWWIIAQRDDHIKPAKWVSRIGGLYPAGELLQLLNLHVPPITWYLSDLGFIAVGAGLILTFRRDDSQKYFSRAYKVAVLCSFVAVGQEIIMIDGRQLEGFVELGRETGVAGDPIDLVIFIVMTFITIALLSNADMRARQLNDNAYLAALVMSEPRTRRTVRPTGRTTPKGTRPTSTKKRRK